MKVSEKDVLAVAELAHLELTAAERERMVRDLNSILGYIDRLNQLDTSNVPPMQHSFSESESTSIASQMRPDELKPSISHADAMANAPQTDGVYFKVPKVIEK